MAERKPRGYWTMKRVGELVDDLYRRGNVLEAREFQKKYGGAFRAIEMESERKEREAIERGEATPPHLTYIRFLEERGIKPPRSKTAIGYERKRQIDKLLEGGPKTIEEVKKYLGIRNDSSQVYKIIRKYGRLNIAIKRGRGRARGNFSNSDLFLTNSHTIVYLKENLLSQYFAGIIRPNLRQHGKGVITVILRNKIPDQIIKKIWNYYRELEEMGVLLPQ